MTAAARNVNQSSLFVFAEVSRRMEREAEATARHNGRHAEAAIFARRASDNAAAMAALIRAAETDAHAENATRTEGATR